MNWPTEQINQTVFVKISCPVTECPNKKTFMIHENDYNKWKSGGLIQNIFPHLSIDDREMLISGICQPCWKDIYEDPKD